MVRDAWRSVAYYGNYGRLNIFLWRKKGKGMSRCFFGKMFCRESDPNRS
jgi:hypothetical protein